jgi:predicted sugar kinase
MVKAMTSETSGDIFTQQENERKDNTVARAIMDMTREFNVKGRVVVTQASQDGVRVVKVDPPFSTADITFCDNE